MFAIANFVSAGWRVSPKIRDATPLHSLKLQSGDTIVHDGKMDVGAIDIINTIYI